MNPATLFPMFLKLGGRPCLAVGAGTVAESKIASLIEADAQVLVVAPDATSGVRSWAQENLVEWRQRGFQPDDLDGTSQTDLPGSHAAGSPVQYRGRSGALRFLLSGGGATRSAANCRIYFWTKPGSGATLENRT